MRTTTRTLPNRRLMIVTVTGLLAVAACGSSGAGGASVTTVKSGAASSGTTAKASGGSSGSISDTMLAAFKALDKGECDKAKTAGDSMSLGSGADAFGQLGDMGKAFDKLATSGPSEIRSDFATMGKAFTAMGKVYGDLGLDDPTKLAEIMKDPAKAAQVAEAAKSLDTTDFKAASDHISAWVEKKCPGQG